MIYNYPNDYYNIYEDNFGECAPILFQYENSDIDENENGIYEQNMNNENNDKSFKIKIVIDETTSAINEKNTKEKTEKEIEQKSKKEKTREKEKEKFVPKFNITHKDNTTNNNESNEDFTLILKKKRGREKKGESEIIHNKYSDDNLRRKCKHLVLQNVMKFFNNKIKEIYKNIGYGMTIKKLLITNQAQISNATIPFNKIFLNKKLSEIFSVNISTRYTNFKPEHNKLLISKLLNDEDETKRNYFKELFSLTFVECLRHFNGSRNIPILNGLTLLNELNIENEIDEEYSKTLRFYIDNYEKIMERKRDKKK
jgi:hypothetical protein